MSPDSPNQPGSGDRGQRGESNGTEGRGGRFGSDQGWPRWTILVLVAVVVGAILLQFLASSTPSDQISYGDFMDKLGADQVSEATFDNANGHISGTLDDGTNFSTTAPIQPSDEAQACLLYTSDAADE